MCSLPSPFWLPFRCIASPLLRPSSCFLTEILRTCIITQGSHIATTNIIVCLLFDLFLKSDKLINPFDMDCLKVPFPQFEVHDLSEAKFRLWKMILLLVEVRKHPTVVRAHVPVAHPSYGILETSWSARIKRHVSCVDPQLSVHGALKTDGHANI